MLELVSGDGPMDSNVSLYKAKILIVSSLTLPPNVGTGGSEASILIYSSSYS